MPTPVSAPAFRCSYFFSISMRKRFGWSENFYHPGPDAGSALNAALGLIPNLLELHASGTSLDFLRVSDLTNFRLQKLLAINQFPIVGDGSFTGNYVNDAILWSLLGSDGRRVRNWTRNPPDKWIANNGQLVLGSAFFIPFIADLVRFGFVLRGLPRPQVQLRITAWDQTVGNITVPAHGFTTPLKIRVKGVRTLFPKTFNRIFLVTVVDPNTLSIASWTAIAPVTPIDLSNAVAAAQYFVNSAVVGSPTASQDGSYPLGVSAHKTGRPFNLAIGKSKGRRRPAPGVLVAS